MISLTASRLVLQGKEVIREPAGDLYALACDHLRGREAHGLVILGVFGSGKSSLCQRLAQGVDGAPPVTAVPLSMVGRAPDIETGLHRTLGPQRLAEARAGERILLLDGLDEVPTPRIGSYAAWFDTVTSMVGPRWLLTSRPGHARTSEEQDPEQADTLSCAGVDTVIVDPVDRATIERFVGDLPGGKGLLRSVQGLADLAGSPLLLHIIEATAPHIEPGRPIDAWGLFDAWLRHALHSGPGHDEVLERLESLAWSTFRESGWSTETMSFAPGALKEARMPIELRRTLLVTELDGRVRFGHRSLFEYLIASHMAPRLAANQGHGPDELTGLRITDATRAFLVGRVGRMPVQIDGDRVRIPRGNFVAGNTLAPDERRLRIAHVAEPYWIARAPVSGADWADFLRRHPDHRQDASYLPHWGHTRRLPVGHAVRPVYAIWPEDAEAYATDAGARLPTADEWEKAVRGIDGRGWPWGDFWRQGLCCTAELGLPEPLPLRALGAHGDAALFDACGGVFEYTSTPYRDDADRGRVVMGGCFTHPAPVSRPSLRLSHTLSGRLKAGVRLAWDDT